MENDDYITTVTASSTKHHDCHRHRHRLHTTTTTNNNNNNNNNNTLARAHTLTHKHKHICAHIIIPATATTAQVFECVAGIFGDVFSETLGDQTREVASTPTLAPDPNP